MAKATKTTLTVTVELSDTDRELLRQVASVQCGACSCAIDPAKTSFVVDGSTIRSLVEDRPAPRKVWTIPEGAGLGYERGGYIPGDPVPGALHAYERVVPRDDDGTWTTEVNPTVVEKVTKHYNVIAEFTEPREIRRNFTDFPEEDRG
jgi:hypothetical protein